jgi:cellulose biosynthesis protein BcsQ
MNATTIAFINNKGGVGKTTLVHHLSWMFAQMGRTVVAADLDPQMNLTAYFLDEDRVEELLEADGVECGTVFDCVNPLRKGTGDLTEPYLERIDDKLFLIPGDLSMSLFEDQLSSQWSACMDGDERAFRVVSVFGRILESAANLTNADLVLVDLGPNLGASNRAALIAADHVVVPLSPDLFSLQGLQNLGPTLRRWKREWADRKTKNPEPTLTIPRGEPSPLGYVVLQHSERLDRPVKAYRKWIARIPGVYRTAVLDEPPGDLSSPEEDPHCLALLKHYRSLLPLGHEAHKAIFNLKPADGAIGAHFQAVQAAYRAFRDLASVIDQKRIAGVTA